MSFSGIVTAQSENAMERLINRLKEDSVDHELSFERGGQHNILIVFSDEPALKKYLKLIDSDIANYIVVGESRPNFSRA